MKDASWCHAYVFTALPLGREGVTSDATACMEALAENSASLAVTGGFAGFDAQCLVATVQTQMGPRLLREGLS